MVPYDLQVKSIDYRQVKRRTRTVSSYAGIFFRLLKLKKYGI